LARINLEKFTFNKGIGKFLQNNIILENIGKEKYFLNGT